MKEALVTLKEFLNTNEGKKAILNWISLIEALEDKDEQINKLKEKIKKYEEFFKTLDSFLPKQNSMFDLIG